MKEKTFCIEGGSFNGVLFFNFCGNDVFQNSVADTWLWKIDPKHGYTVKGVYNMLTSEQKHVYSPFTDIVWNKAVFLKVSLFVQQLLDKRIPKKDNFARCGYLHSRSLVSFGVAGNRKQLIVCLWSAIFVGVFGRLFYGG